MMTLLNAIGWGLLILLPLANPLTAVAMFLSLADEMNFQQRNRQALQSAVYVFLIMLITWFAGSAVLNTFGISIPGLRVAGGMIVAFIGFRMLFPVQQVHEAPEVQHKQDELDAAPHSPQTVNIAFVPIAMPGTAGPGTIAVIISTAASVRSGVDYPAWILMVAPIICFLLVAIMLWVALRCSGPIMRLVGKGGIEALSRLMGFLLVCMGIQFVINGVVDVATHLH
ncbi:MarC family NAAT transporter [Tatumella sp. TA1]|uniref:MarC family NAAT transporter n=1 Tax=Rosenbergiella collisarenosi TaxID=1544695 RepID=UPI0008F8FF2B|nr:MarC family NAAT transporter [Rosenbergiella collisarenosi]MBT0719837.1 MarC family NAAT transporter [Rosenbergiella collisarenosi]QGX90468.1 MarC family NAAT transporter [Tatumella sp. TA1]